MSDTQILFQEALDSLVAKLQQDPYILAVILLGSLSHDVVWEKSDIDLLLVAQEGKHRATGFSLVERGVNIHASLQTRSEFRKCLEGAVRSSFVHSLLVKGRLLYSRDETLAELFEARHGLGARDREIRLLAQACHVLPSLAKAEKWLHTRRDAAYSFFWVMKALDALASIEVLLNGEVTEREVIQQALRYNPLFFNQVYTDFIHGEKTPESVLARLELINAYLRERIPVLFRPLLEYLGESGGIRSSTEINHHFSRQLNVEGVDLALEWLADEGVIRKLSAPVRLTEKSRVDVEEAAYYYEGEIS
jgi:predicted nucleotidyltransferase